MQKNKIQIELGTSEIELLANLLKETINSLSRSLTLDKNENSLMELTGYPNVSDVEFCIDTYQNVMKQLKDLQNELNRNKIIYLDHDNVFRPEERVHVYRVKRSGHDRLMYIHESRHGSFFVYETIEKLIEYYTDSNESDYRFESETEMECFLQYR